MPITTDAARRRLEAAGAIRAETEEMPGLEVWRSKDGRTVLGLHPSSMGVVEFAHGHSVVLLRWLLALDRPDLLDAEAEIVRLRAEAERQRAELRRLRGEMADVAGLYPGIITLRAERDAARAEFERLRATIQDVYPAVASRAIALREAGETVAAEAWERYAVRLYLAAYGGDAP